jgi:hypothetical protein
MLEAMETREKPRGVPIEIIPAEGTMARELHDFRTRMGEERGRAIPRRVMAALISEHKTEDDPYDCPVPYTTYWESGRRPITELVARRYGRAFGLVPLLEWVPVLKGAKVPQPGQPVPVSAQTGMAPSALAPPGSWGRALNDLREANQVIRGEMARRLDVEPSEITKREGGHLVKAAWVERYAADFGVRLRLRWVPATP